MIGIHWRWHRLAATAAYCSVLLLTGLSVNILGPAGPSLMKHLRSATTEVGAVFSAEGLGNFVGSALAGPILARYKAHRIIAIAAVVVFVCVGAVPSCSALAHVVFLYLFVGAASGLANTASNTMVTWAWRGSAGTLGAVLNLVNACFPLGGSTAPFLVLLCERRVGNSLVSFSCISVFALLPCANAMLLETPAAPPAPPVDLPSPPKRADSFGGSSALGSSAVCGIDLGSRRAYVRWTVLAPLLTTIWLCIGAEIAYAAWIYTYATHCASMRSEEAAYLTSLYWSSFTVARLAATPLAAYVSPGAILVPALALEVFSLLSLAALPPTGFTLWVGTIGAGIGISVLFSNVLSLLARYGLLSTRVTGAMGAAAAIGHMTIPSLAGMSIDRLGYDSLLPLLAVINSVGFVLTAMVVLHLHASFQPVGSTSTLPPGSPETIPLNPFKAGTAKRSADLEGDGWELQNGRNGTHRRHDIDREEAIAI